MKTCLPTPLPVALQLQELPNNASVFMYDVAIERVRRAGAEGR
jgi:hypothetical protein